MVPIYFPQFPNRGNLASSSFAVIQGMLFFIVPIIENASIIETWLLTLNAAFLSFYIS